jgi:6,7-dimethyl-8-ribityllumazine synthase
MTAHEPLPHKGIHAVEVDATGLRIALVCARFNLDITGRLESGARSALTSRGAADDDVHTVWVPGALEVPVAANLLARSGRYDAVVGIGAVVRGETYHFEVVSNESAAGLMRVSLDTGVVVTNGIITVDDMAQALDRVGGAHGHKGAEAAVAAVETLLAVRAVQAG